jgi:hypothetical protein
MLPLVGTEIFLATNGSATRSPIPHEVVAARDEDARPAGQVLQTRKKILLRQSSQTTPQHTATYATEYTSEANAASGTAG